MAIETSKDSSELAQGGSTSRSDAGWRVGLVAASAALLGLFVVWHLWTIAAAAQDRLAFESQVGHSAMRPSLAIVLFCVLFVFLASYWPTLRRDVARLSAGGSRKSMGYRRRLEVVALLVAIAFGVVHGASIGGVSGPAPDYDAVCATQSSTWQSIPVVALSHLLGVLAAASAVGLAVARVASERFVALSALWAARLGVAVLVSLFLLGAVAVFRFATGSGAIFLL